MSWGTLEWSVAANFVLAAATALAGFLALFAAVKTVRSTKEASEISERLLLQQLGVQRDELESLRSDQRPWVKASFELVDVIDNPDETPSKMLRMKFRVTNLGSRPATNIHCLYGTHGPNLAEQLQSMINNVDTYSRQDLKTFGYTLFPGESHTESGTSAFLINYHDGPMSLYFGGIVQYRASQTSTWLVTPFAFVATFEVDEAGRITASSVEPNFSYSGHPS